MKIFIFGFVISIIIGLVIVGLIEKANYSIHTWDEHRVLISFRGDFEDENSIITDHEGYGSLFYMWHGPIDENSIELAKEYIISDLTKKGVKVDGNVIITNITPLDDWK